MKATFNLKETKLKATFSIVKVIPEDGLRQEVQTELDRIDNQLDVINDTIIDNKQKCDEGLEQLASELESLQDTHSQNSTQLENISSILEDSYNELSQNLDNVSNDLQAITGDVENISGEIENFITEQKVMELISSIQQFEHKIVEQLPQVGNPNIMYLVAKQNVENVYEEYIWVPALNKYEDIGSTAVDLTDYAKLEQLPTKLSDLEDDKHYLTTHQDLSHVLTKSDFMIQLLQLAKADLSNVSSAYDYVISESTYGGGESGKRKWKNGRFEQWGVAITNATGETEFTIHENFKDVNFSIFIEPREMGNWFHYAYPSGIKKFKTRITDMYGTFRPVKIQWKAEGYWK